MKVLDRLKQTRVWAPLVIAAGSLIAWYNGVDYTPDAQAETVTLIEQIVSQLDKLLLAVGIGVGGYGVYSGTKS